MQAGTRNWTALFFGSLDSGNAITVDKPPASLWVMALSGRIFGFSSWSMLVPQALIGVGAVALLWATVRRVSGPGAGLLAGTVLALTPVAVLMFRFNDPDALLVLLMVAAAYCTLRAIEKEGIRWLLLAGLVLGFGFLFPAGFPEMNRRGVEGTSPRRSGGMDVASTNAELVALLKSAPTKWSAATITGSSAASLELASGTAVLGIGGFMGSDPYPTLDQFKSYLASGQIRYFLPRPILAGRFGGAFPGTPGGAPPGGDGGGPVRGGPDGFANGTATQISQWVTENYTAITIGGQTIYNLSQPKT